MLTINYVKLIEVTGVTSFVKLVRKDQEFWVSGTDLQAIEFWVYCP